VTPQGHPRRIFQTAIERGNIVMAEATARELARISLEEALELVLLYAAYAPTKLERAALRGSVATSTRARVAAESAARSVRVGDLRAGEREAGAKLLSELARR
jgi:hypothetical protein